MTSNPAQRLDRWLWLLPLLALAVWSIAHRDLPWVLWSGDEMEYADVARRVARGDGFTASLIYPAELEYGAARDHPSLVRAPLWPLFMALVFAVTGPEEWAIHAALLLLFCAVVGIATALGRALAGPAAGALAGVAAASSPQTLVLSLLGGTETLYSALTLLLFLLMARGRRALWLGMVCGLAYLTRYNGIVLFPVALLWVLLGPAPRRAILECIAGFACVALPWWIRNALLTANPFFTYYLWAIWFSPHARTYTTTLLHMLEPDPGAPTAMNPFEKARLLLPMMLVQWPIASANLAACVGVGVACSRRDRLSAAFALLALGTTVGLAFALPRGRYFAPLFPTLLALGVAGWHRFGGRLRWVGLAFLLAAPLLPAVPPEAPDLQLLRQLVHGSRDFEAAPRPWARCIDEADLVVGESASNIAWVTDATTIWLPASQEDFWRVVEAHPVDWVYLKHRTELLSDRFAAQFGPRPDCGPHLFERRRVRRGAEP